MNTNTPGNRPPGRSHHKKTDAFTRDLCDQEAAKIIGGTTKQSPSIVDEDDCSFPSKGAPFLSPEL